MSESGASVNLVGHPGFPDQKVLPTSLTSGIPLSPSVQIISPSWPPPTAKKITPKVETELQKVAFREYRDMGPERSLAEVAKIKKLHVKESVLKEWAETWDWENRVFDHRIAEQSKRLLERMEAEPDATYIPHPDQVKFPGVFVLDPEYVKIMGSVDRKKDAETLWKIMQTRILMYERQKAKLEFEIQALCGNGDGERGSSGGARQMVIVNITGR